MISLPGLSRDASLLVCAFIAVAGLVVLIARFKLNAFIALMLASLFVGLCSGMRLPDIAKGFQEGVGITLGFIAVVVGLGTVLGKMLAESGGAEVVATTLTKAFGEKRIHWTLMMVAFAVGLPVFFGVGLVLLVPILFNLARETKAPLLSLAIPVMAGLSVSHGLVPPHPGPMVAIERLGADVGTTIFYAILVGVPTAAIAGPVLGKFIGRRMPVELGGIGAQLIQQSKPRSLPGFGLALFTMLLPALLMLLATVVDLALSKENHLRDWADFLGSPLVSMLIAVLFSFYSFGAARGFDRRQILKFTEDCVGPAAGIILVVGAGGGFSKVLEHSGVARAIAEAAGGIKISPLLLGWLVAALIRVAVGSATVTITMTAAILAPVSASVPGTKPELLVLAMGAGSLILSHLNDGGFWLVKEYLNLTVPQTLKTWTVVETVISVVALLLILLVAQLI